MYYIKIIGFEKNLEEGIIFKEDLYVKIEYNDLVRTTTTKWEENSPNWNEIFLFEEKPQKIKIILMDRDKFSSDDIKKEGELPINKANDLLDVMFNGISIKHGFVNITSLYDHSVIMKDIELDKNEILYLIGAIDDKDKIIEGKKTIIDEYLKTEDLKNKKIKRLQEDLDDARDAASKSIEEKDTRDNLIIEMGEKFNMIKKIIER